ncbi:hypothetical protein [Bacterioplanoides sp.]|uniref:hypothetical protein n=1 Tax=Bacterioplanoides sp. TaxID=2066072 RepID=UPI003AFFCD67
MEGITEVIEESRRLVNEVTGTVAHLNQIQQKAAGLSGFQIAEKARLAEQAVAESLAMIQRMNEALGHVLCVVEVIANGESK